MGLKDVAKILHRIKIIKSLTPMKTAKRTSVVLSSFNNIWYTDFQFQNNKFIKIRLFFIGFF